MNRKSRTPFEILATSIDLAFGATLFVPGDWRSAVLIHSAEEFRIQLERVFGGTPSKSELVDVLPRIRTIVMSHSEIDQIEDGHFLPLLIEFCEERRLEDDGNPSDLARLVEAHACGCLDSFIDRQVAVFNHDYRKSTASQLEAEASDYLSEGWAALAYARELREIPPLEGVLSTS